MADITGIVSSGDIYALVSQIATGQTILPQIIKIASSASCKTLTMTYGASTLLAVDSASLSGRKYLTIRNDGKRTILVGEQSSESIYEEGYPIEPNQIVQFAFEGDSTVDLYGRSIGAICECTVWES